MFLNHEEIASAIKRVTGGRDVRCAVAFWGSGAARELMNFNKRVPDARLICDLSMGGTNPAELRALGAPDNADLRHVPRLHAKVYMSSEGTVICSANASENGIGFQGGGPGLIEAGTFHDLNSATAKSAANWFEALWLNAKEVDDPALSIAEHSWSRRPEPPPSPEFGSLLDALASGDELVRGIGLAFTSTTATEADLQDTIQAVTKQADLNPVQRDEIRNWKAEDLFSGWSAAEISAWPMRFVCAHRHGKGRVRYYFYERVHAVILDGGRGMILARKTRRLQSAIGLAQPRTAIEAIDAKRLSEIFAYIKGDGLLCEHGGKVAELIQLMSRRSVSAG
jgi:hypothetical protein